MHDAGMKICRKCGEIKSRTEFYAHTKMADGRLNFCKGCVKARVNQHRAKNLEKIRAYDRGRGLIPERKAANKARAHRYKGRYQARVFRAANPDEYQAHSKLGSALRAGKIQKQPCEVCGTNKGVHGHHDDYAKPLDVRWLCPEHHGERHRELNDERRKSRNAALPDPVLR